MGELNENEILYAFTVNDNSGIYRKYLDDEKIQDAHIVYSNQLEFTNIFYENNNWQEVFLLYYKGVISKQNNAAEASPNKSVSVLADS